MKEEKLYTRHLRPSIQNALSVMFFVNLIFVACAKGETDEQTFKIMLVFLGLSAVIGFILAEWGKFEA